MKLPILQMFGVLLISTVSMTPVLATAVEEEPSVFFLEADNDSLQTTQVINDTTSEDEVSEEQDEVSSESTETNTTTQDKPDGQAQPATLKSTDADALTDTEIPVSQWQKTKGYPPDYIVDYGNGPESGTIYYVNEANDLDDVAPQPDPADRSPREDIGY